MTLSADPGAAFSPHNRVVLLDTLRPPEGYRFDAAVATTFTLGLNAALLPPLAFGSQTFRSTSPDPISAMEAIRSAAGSIDIFCQAGMVGVPRSAPALLAFVEPMVHQVRAPRRGLFHPKVWCVRYTNEVGHRAYRALILSRNLTEDRTWDVALRLDSHRLSPTPIDSNRGLADLIRSLPSRAVRPIHPERASRVLTLAEEISRVEWELPELVTSAVFHLYDAASPSVPPSRPSLVVSPFLDDDGLTEVLDVERGCAVVSRPEALDKLDPTVLKRIETYVLDPGFVVEPETEEVVEGQPDSAERPGRQATSLLSGLHAKFYVTTAPRAWSKRRVFIGSANATSAAFGGNTELLVELEGHRAHFDREVLLDLDSGFGGLLEPYHPSGGAEPSPEDEEQKALDRALRTIATISHTVEVTAGGGQAPSHTLTLTSAKGYRVEPEWRVELELLTLPGRTREVDPAEAVREVFTGVETSDVTPFVVVRLIGQQLEASTVVIAELVGDPADRLDVILAKQIDSPEKFLRFILLLLSFGDSSLLALLTGKGGGEPIDAFAVLGERGLLELVLRALASNPEVLDDISGLVERLQATDAGREHLPEGFEEFWRQVELARESLGSLR